MAELPDADGLDAPNGRDRILLQHLVAGRGTREIAAELNISEKGLKQRLGVLYRHYGCRNRIELIMLALRRGWVAIEPEP
jgi:DNA-binding NarL/FixJ family response regulator